MKRLIFFGTGSVCRGNRTKKDERGTNFRTFASTFSFLSFSFSRFQPGDRARDRERARERKLHGRWKPSVVKILRGRGGGRGREIWQVLIRRRMEGNVEHRVSFKNRGREEGDAGLNARDTNIADLLSCGSARDQLVCRPIIVQTSYQPLPFLFIRPPLHRREKKLGGTSGGGKKGGGGRTRAINKHRGRGRKKRNPLSFVYSRKASNNKGKVSSRSPFPTIPPIRHPFRVHALSLSPPRKSYVTPRMEDDEKPGAVCLAFVDREVYVGAEGEAKGDGQKKRRKISNCVREEVAVKRLDMTKGNKKKNDTGAGREETAEKNEGKRQGWSCGKDGVKIRKRERGKGTRVKRRNLLRDATL